MSGVAPTVALLHWGDLIDDFLGSIGVSFDAFREQMTGGWMFNYIDALARAGVRTVLVCVTEQVSAPERLTHGPTGATLLALPPPRVYRLVRKRTGDPMLDPPAAWRGVKGRVLVALKDVAPYLATPLRTLGRQLRAEGCRAVLCQEYEYPRFDACVLMGRLMRLPVFATFQGGDFQVSRLEAPLRPLALRRCAGLIVGSGREADRLRDRYGAPPPPIARIVNPLDVDTWRPIDRAKARASLGLPADARIVVCHGRIDVHRKGLDVLLDAWWLLRKSARRDEWLLLVGDGPDRQELRRRIDSSGVGGVVWVDRYVRDRETIRHCLSAADVYALSSRHEGFPVAPVEAMACGLPAVATDVPGVRDIIPDGERSGGIVVPRADAPALADALRRVLDDDGWRRTLGQRARRRAEDAFSLDAVGRQLRAFLLDEPARKSA